MVTSPAWQTHLTDQEERNFEALLEFLRIPSVSTAPERRGDVARAATWVADHLHQAGVPEVELLPTGGHPVVYGRWHAANGAPTLLVYGHYDVQPPEPLELWTSPPFEPTIRDGRIYARGAADMKANLLTLIQAVEALARTEGAPPVNLTLLFEGEEEIGSPNLPAVIHAERERLACDVVLSADGGMDGPNSPSLVVALKGLAGCQLDLRTGTTDLHSGSYGATVPNAVQTLVQLLATLHTRDGRVAVEGFYDNVRALTPGERAEIAAVPFDESQFLAEAGASTLWGEPGHTPQERRWARPTLDLNGIWGGFQGEGIKTVTPCAAHAKITCRLVPDQEPDAIIDLIERHIAGHCPPGVETAIRRLPGSARPYALRRDQPALLIAARVLREVYGSEPLIVRTGGTVPVTDVFQRELGADTVTIGFGLPGSRAHAPNEWFRREDVPTAQRTYAAFLSALATL